MSLFIQMVIAYSTRQEAEGSAEREKCFDFQMRSADLTHVYESSHLKRQESQEGDKTHPLRFEMLYRFEIRDGFCLIHGFPSTWEADCTVSTLA